MNSLQRYDDIPDALRWLLVTIKEVGFPIAVCVWLTWFTTQEMKSHTEAVNKLAQSMDKNTTVLRMIGRKLHVSEE